MPEAWIPPAFRNKAMADTQRKSIDCRDYPSESGCTVRIEGTEDEVLDTAVSHAIAKHGHADTPELRDEIRKLLRNAGA